MEHKRDIKGKILFKHRVVRITKIFKHKAVQITKIFKYRAIQIQDHLRTKLFNYKIAKTRKPEVMIKVISMI